MNEAEYNSKLIELRANFRKAENALIIEFGIAQSNYKVGDIISNSSQTILIKEVSGYSIYGKVVPVYYGVCLTKALKPMKNKIDGAIYDLNTNDPITLLKAGNL